MERVTKYFRENFFVFLVFMLPSMAFVFPIIIASPFYADDISRVYSGAFVWHEIGRPLATMIAVLYSYSFDTIIDPTPFNWLSCGVLLGLTSYVFYKNYELLLGKYVSFIISIPLAINPFLIENLLYRFDSVGMVFGYFLSVLAICYNVGYGKKVQFLISLLFLLLSLMLYQSMINVFLVLAVFDLFVNLNQKKSSSFIRNFYIIMGRVACAFSAIIIYYLLMIILGLGTVGPDTDFGFHTISDFASNYIDYWGTYYEFVLHFPVFFLLIGFLLFLYTVYYLVVDFHKAFIFLSLVVVASVFSLSFIGLFENADIQPRIMASTVFIPIFLLYIFSKFRRFTLFSLLLYLLPVYIFVGRVSVIHSESQKYEMPIVFDAAMSLNNYYPKGVVYNLGYLPYTKKIENLVNRTPFQGFYKNSDWVLAGKLSGFYFGDIVNEWHDEALMRNLWLCSSRENWEELFDRPGLYSLVRFEESSYILWGEICSE